ncbi:melatonin receptor type 1B-A-like [Acanthaster planci]|uniref:Melatonin receptor type 1B-A-like n=1 Tax=Acanthaster planci TaxID=133434 RepID=A0A8B7XHL7_ACAPL|nr:melatonin receptor type 1B-A-like [Acanthaster planci]XP_022079722.1 melatonin receptor type 1B-A-like [Acanthaster planci]
MDTKSTLVFIKALNISDDSFTNCASAVAISTLDNMTEMSLKNHSMSASLQTYPERVVVAVFIFLISLTSITGNTMVILSVTFSQKLRTSTNVFVVSLSVADLLAGFAAPMSTVGLLTPGDKWPLSSEVPCSIAGSLLYISSASSLFNLASIALNRLILIKRPMTLYRSLYNKRNLFINVIINWIVPVCTMSLPPLFGIGGWGYDEQHHSCSDRDTHPNAKTFEMIQTSVSYPIPLIVIVTSYLAIFVHVRRHFKRQKALHGIVATHVSATSSTEGSSFVVIEGATAAKSAHVERINRQQLEITKNLFTAVCAFFICITPYCVALFIPNNDRFLLFGGLLFFCNSIANPIIYAAKHPQFKRVMRCLLRCQYLQIEQPSDTLKALIACAQSQKQKPAES